MNGAMTNVATILRKEWLELRQDRSILLGTLLPPLLLTLLPLALVAGVGLAPADELGDGDLSRVAGVNPALAGLEPRELAQAVIGQQLSILLLLMPVIVPSVIASYSIVGEKTRRTLEPLLGKCLAALLPAVAVTWLAGAIFVAGLAALAVSGRVFAAVVSPAWLLVLLVCAPLLALIAVAAMVAVSARVNDPLTAQQLSGVLVLPIATVIIGQVAGLLVLRPALVLAAAAILAALAALAVWGAVRLFQREVILTRWR